MSRFSRRNTTRSGSRGERVQAQTQGDVVIDRNTTKEPMVSNEPKPEETASVGLSVSVGHSAEYGRDKFEVAAWCTLPCAPDDASREVAYNQCKEDVYGRIDAMRQEVVKVFNLPFEEGSE